MGLDISHMWHRKKAKWYYSRNRDMEIKNNLTMTRGEGDKDNEGKKGKG